MPRGRGHVGRVLPCDLSVEWGWGLCTKRGQRKPSPVPVVAAGTEPRGPFPCVLSWKFSGTKAFSKCVDFTRFSVTNKRNWKS